MDDIVEHALRIALAHRHYARGGYVSPDLRAMLEALRFHEPARGDLAGMPGKQPGPNASQLTPKPAADSQTPGPAPAGRAARWGTPTWRGA